MAENRKTIRDSPKSTKGAVVHSGYKFVLRLLVLIFHEKINKLCTVEINQRDFFTPFHAFVHLFARTYRYVRYSYVQVRRANDDEHPVSNTSTSSSLPEAPTFGRYIFYDRKKHQNVGASLWYKKYYRKSHHRSSQSRGV